jgi:stage IV sporulation protein FB
MSWSIPLFSLAGTEVRLHLTFLLLLAWIGLQAGQAGGVAAAISGMAFIGLLFGCVLLHEFGHVFAARRYGVKTPDITLLPIGGVARLERIPEKPSEELVVALAGPTVNVVIAALLALAIGGIPPVEMVAGLEDSGHDMAGRLFWANVSLVVFNLLPAFPMDGGRVLRATLAWRLGFRRATNIAAMVGQALAVALGLFGLLGGAPLLALVAVFVWLGAAAENQGVQLRDLARGMIAADAMETRFETLPVTASIETAVAALLRSAQHDFPVIDGAGRLRGILTRDDMLRALGEQGAEAPVLPALRGEVPAIHHRAPLQDALAAMQASAGPIAVVDGAGRLLGLLTQENLGEMLMVQAARAARAPPRHPWPGPA